MGCRIHIIGAPAGNLAFRLWPDPTDQINALAVGASYDSTATDGMVVCTYAGPGQWAVTGSRSG